MTETELNQAKDRYIRFYMDGMDLKDILATIEMQLGNEVNHMNQEEFEEHLWDQWEDEEIIEEILQG